MTQIKTEKLIERLRKGKFFKADTARLDTESPAEFVNDLRSEGYGVAFQERRIGTKWEISLAKSFNADFAAHEIPGAVFFSFHSVPVFQRCVMVNSENDRLTGISVLMRLTIFAVSEPEGELALKSGKGYKLDKMPDGWQLKPMSNRKVTLSVEFLRKRGWRFDYLKDYLPKEYLPKDYSPLRDAE